MTESFYIVAILWALDLATAMTAGSDSKHHDTRLISWISLGTAFALAALFRQVFLLMVPVILVWVSWRLASVRALSMRQILGRWAVTLSILGLFIAPWTLRNYRVFHTQVLLNTNSGFAFFWGNHPIHGTEFIPLLPPEKYASLIPAELLGRNEAEMDKELLRQGFAFVRADPIRYLVLSVSRAKEYFKFWPTNDSKAASDYSRMLSFGLCLPLVLCGLYLLYSSHYPRKKGSKSRVINPGTSLLVLVGFLYTLVHLMTWALVRYRLPVDAAFIPIAAVSVIAGYERLKDGVRALALDVRRSVT